MVKKIRRGDDFLTKEEKFWEALVEGHGVVVIGMGNRGYRAYGDSCDANSYDGEDYLRKNFAGASFNHEENVYLVARENGRLIWRTKKEMAELSRRKAAASLPQYQKPLGLAGVC